MLCTAVRIQQFIKAEPLGCLHGNDPVAHEMPDNFSSIIDFFLGIGNEFGIYIGGLVDRLFDFGFNFVGSITYLAYGFA